MTQRTDCAHTHDGRFWLQSLLVQSLSWIGVLSLLSSNLVLAQTSPDAVVVPTIKDSKPPAAALRVAKSAPDTPQSAPSPARLARLRQRLSPKPAAVIPAPRKPQVSTAPAPGVSVPKVRSVAQPTTKLPSTAQARPTQTWKKAAPLPAPNYNNAYIDPTDYGIGATRGYSAPSKVVLSERSTGCKAVLRQGQGVTGSICGTAPRQRKLVAVRRTARSWATRSRAAATTGIAPVQVGPISVSASGFSATRRTPSSQGQIAFVKPVPRQSGVVLNRTLRPTEQPGNANTGLLFPLTIPAQITSLFGWRIHPLSGDRRFHAGTDLGAPLGTPVVAADEGDVAFANFLGGYGLTVVLDHNEFTQQTLYAHLSEIFVEPGEWVEQGTVIGRVGSTGNSSGPHLHFETRQLTPSGWIATDPGADLEYAVAQLVQALQTAKVP